MAKHASQLCIQFLALPNLPSLIGARDKDKEWIFNPRAFGQTTQDVGPGSNQQEENMNQAVTIAESGEISLMPNGDTTMQFMAVWSTVSAVSVGLYVGSHDPLGFLQLMIIHAGRYPNATDPAGTQAGVKWLHLNEDLLDSSSAGIFRLPGGHRILCR